MNLEYFVNGIENKGKEFFLNNFNFSKMNNIDKLRITMYAGVASLGLLIAGNGFYEMVKEKPIKSTVEQLVLEPSLECNIPEPTLDFNFKNKELKLNPYKNKEIKKLADLTFSEVAECGNKNSFDIETIKLVASSILNRVDKHRKEFGYTLDEVKKGYYGAKTNLYQQAKTFKFNSEINKQAYFEIYKISKEIYENKNKRKKAEFYFTKSEIQNLKRKGSFDFSQVELVASTSKYCGFRYK